MDADADLMQRVAGGDTDAFRVLVERNEKAAYNFFLRLTWIPEDAEDLTQELFVALFRAAGRYRPEAPFRAYFYRIATNLAMSHLRKRKLRAAVSIDAMIESGFDVASGRSEDDPAASVDSREIRRAYEAALARLPHEWRIALELRIARELSYEEIAGAMGKSVSAVESILFRARERMAEEMDRYEKDGNEL
ncbi:MAG TPA: sigma-70 family RNA polymerase sigma factor [Candidatus Krumholzibacteriaceae bacterium]